MLTYSGINRPLFIYQNSNLIELKGSKFTFNKSDDVSKGIIVEQSIELNKGTIIYACSDGYQDQFGGPNNKKFSSGSFKKILQKCAQKEYIEQKYFLNRTIENWRGENEQTDDILVFSLKI
ncbi:MAG: SpoIIE family protein phosphatase [Bacteroidetes bacterium]|nr:SpoIIE family protein phosphatase [Bacteroidota bacterium]